jgi:protein SCO1/2/putative membrane protein
LNPSYRLGLTLVVGSVLASLAVCLVKVPAPPEPERVGRDLGENAFPLGTFRLTERSGREVSDADLAGRVWVAAFVFTRCPLSCPRISSVMKGLQSKFARSNVRLVSVSVDPDHDTPEVLAAYARRFDADPDRWWFLTGPKGRVLDLITDRFKLPVQPSSDADQQAGAEAVLHSERLALVGRGNRVVGYFGSTSPGEVASLVGRALDLDRGASAPPAWARRLPAVNAALNGTCAALLALGWVMIRLRNARGHAAAMASAVVVSTVFLACYLVYHAKVGSVPFRGMGPVRVVYYTVLLSHTLLAAFGVVPLVALTLNHALRRRFHHHARLARVTFPVWMYVSVTGVVIYLMLYHWPAGPSVLVVG